MRPRRRNRFAHAHFNTPAQESVLVESPTSRAGEPAFRATVGAVVSAREAQPQATDIKAGRSDLISHDRHAELVQFEIRGNVDSSDQRVQSVLDGVARVQASHRGFTVAEFGDASATHELNKTLGQDFSHAESLSVPITFLILLVTLAPSSRPRRCCSPSRRAGLDGPVRSCQPRCPCLELDTVRDLVDGDGCRVDYSLFYVKREREERAAGHEGHEAVFRAAATSGQAVLISA